MNNLSFLKFPSAKTETILVFVLIITGLILFFILAGLVREYLKRKRLQHSFFKEALERGLTEKEAWILWKYSLELGRDPFLSLEFKAPFEKIVDLYLTKDPHPDENLVQEMRVKLGFDYVPYFVPIVSTKDIDIFQTGKLHLPNDGTVEVALIDKDERFMFWAIIETERPVPVEELRGKKVSISFIRKGDGIYKFEAPVEEVSREGDKVVLKLPHTFELTRYQRREYARVEVEVPALVGVRTESGEVRWHRGEIVDISAGGAKVCISLNELEKEFQPGAEVILKFTLAGREFKPRSTVVNVYPRRHSTCYGVKFENLTTEEQKAIHDFVKKEQKKLAQTACPEGKGIAP